MHTQPNSCNAMSNATDADRLSRGTNSLILSSGDNPTVVMLFFTFWSSLAVFMVTKLLYFR